MFLLMLLGRILCLQSREDSGFFVGFLVLDFGFFFFGFRALFMTQRILFQLSFRSTDVERPTSKICLLTINALCSEGRSSCGCLAHSSLPPEPGSQVTGLSRELLLVTCPAVKRFVPSPAGLS